MLLNVREGTGLYLYTYIYFFSGKGDVRYISLKWSFFIVTYIKYLLLMFTHGCITHRVESGGVCRVSVCVSSAAWTVGKPCSHGSSPHTAATRWHYSISKARTGMAHDDIFIHSQNAEGSKERQVQSSTHTNASPTD